VDYFKDKVAVVLGCSAAAGIGHAIARALAERGAKLVVAARRFEKVQALADITGGHAVRCDATREGDIKALARAALDRYGRVDIAVNAAGMSLSSGKIADISDSLLQDVMQLNFFANVYFVRHMAEAIQNDGAIVLFSSMSATHPLDGIVGYGCAKAATDCLVRYAAVEYGPRNIRVNSILPGLIWSELAAPLFSAPGVEPVLTKEIPLGRLGKPEEAAEAALWMCGPSYVTGLSIPIAGGQQLNRYPFPSEYPGGAENLDAATHAQAQRNEQLRS
jgi:NAD(P)-dependent dehydrogenase (short-subunit alcohol dehydrogenase family)